MIFASAELRLDSTITNLLEQTFNTEYFVPAFICLLVAVVALWYAARSGAKNRSKTAPIITWTIFMAAAVVLSMLYFQRTELEAGVAGWIVVVVGLIWLGSAATSKHGTFIWLGIGFFLIAVIVAGSIRYPELNVSNIAASIQNPELNVLNMVANLWLAVQIMVNVIASYFTIWF